MKNPFRELIRLAEAEGDERNSFYDHISDEEKEKNNTLKIKPKFHSKFEEDQWYYNMVDPETGERYDIPMLNPVQSNYYDLYIKYMKLKERSAETFERIINWE